MKKRTYNPDLFRDSYADYKAEEDKEPTIDEIITIIDNAINEIDEIIGRQAYEEALPKLLNLYDLYADRSLMHDLIEKLGEETYADCFTWICYRITFCYSECQDYVRAFFYIDQVRGQDINCFIEWINVMVNGGRLDAYDTVEEYLKDPSQLRQVFEEEEMQKIMDFLKRRMGYLHIEHREIEEARKIFTDLLSNPSSAEFAQQELDYLDSLESLEQSKKE